MLIQADFSAVPDRVLPLSGGIYDFEVLSVETKQPKKETTKGINVVVKLSVHSDGPNKGRQITDYIFVSTDQSLSDEERQRGLTPIKRLALAAGVPFGADGLNVMSIQGKIVKALITPNTYKDDNGNVRDTTRISRYFIPGDAEMSASVSTTPLL